MKKSSPVVVDNLLRNVHQESLMAGIATALTMSSTSLLKANTTCKTASGHQDPINNLEGQHGQAPWGWPTNNAGSRLGVEFRLVARALEPLHVGLP